MSVKYPVWGVLPNSTTESTFPHNLSEDEMRYMLNRGHSLSDIEGYSEVEINGLLMPYRTRISPFAAANAPSNYIAVTGIPGQLIEYFHPNAGMVAGSFSSQSAQIRNAPGTFAVTAFGRTLPDAKIFYYLWGEWDDVAKTHQGIDIRNEYNSSAPVKAAHEGQVVFKGGTYGSVAIYDGTYTHYYLHLSSIPSGITVGSTVYFGQTIGNQGATGLSNSNDYHLHYECHSGKSTTGPKGTGALNTTSPYFRMTSGGNRAPELKS